MENVTHTLLGLVGAKAGLERLSPRATLACVIGANLPDIDIAALAGGRWFNLQHHRGITHSIVGTLVLPVIFAGIFCLVDAGAARLKRTPRTLNFLPILLALSLMCATHPILDWTNNYGIRPFLPWTGRWYYGDLVFIADPWLWLILGGALILTSSFTRARIAVYSILILAAVVVFTLAPFEQLGLERTVLFRVVWFTGLASVIAARFLFPGKKWGTRVATTALFLVVIYWAALAMLHNRALDRARDLADQIAASSGETPLRTAAMPMFANPTEWLCVSETDASTFRFIVRLTDAQSEIRPGEVLRFVKPAAREIPLVQKASEDPRAEIFLGFARFPVVEVEGDCVSRALVEFADLRYTQPGRVQRGSFGLSVPVECEGVNESHEND
jgi:inner membrane protein